MLFLLLGALQGSLFSSSQLLTAFGLASLCCAQPCRLAPVPVPHQREAHILWASAVPGLTALLFADCNYLLTSQHPIQGQGTMSYSSLFPAPMQHVVGARDAVAT